MAACWKPGIGRAHNIHLASLPNFSLPGDIAASKRYYQPDLIEPAIDVASDGTIAVPGRAGDRRTHCCRASRARDASRGHTRSLEPDRCMTQAYRLRLWVVGVAVALLGACASAPPAPAPSAAPAMTFEEKMGWILRLEEDRILAIPAPPAPPPRPSRHHPKVVALRSRSRRLLRSRTWSRCSRTSEPRIRRRAALAIGRTRLPAGVAALTPLLGVGHRSRGPADGRLRHRPDR